MKSRGRGLGREVALLFTSHRSPLSERLEQAKPFTFLVPHPHPWLAQLDINTFNELVPFSNKIGENRDILDFETICAY